MGTPASALAFQWTTRARHHAAAPLGWLPGCIAISHRAFDALQPAHRDAVRTAAAKLSALTDEVSEQMDNQLTGGLLARQGVSTIPVDGKLRAAIWSAGERTTAKLRGGALPTALVNAVSGWLVDLRQRAR